MIHVDLTPEEQGVLLDFLQSSLSDLRMEITHTDSATYRAELKSRENVLRRIIDAIGQPQATTSMA